MYIQIKSLLSSNNSKICNFGLLLYLRRSISFISKKLRGLFWSLSFFVPIRIITFSFSRRALSIIDICHICGGFNLPINNQSVILIY